jgi:hypothetical protein
MTRSTEDLLQELAREQARLAELDRARDEIRAKIDSLRSELAASPDTTALRRPAAAAAKCNVPNTSSGKVQMFRSPTRFVSKKTGNPGYAPADWDGRPKDRNLILFSGHEPLKDAGLYSRFNYHMDKGLEVSLPS